MNKNKKELYEENQALRKKLKSYGDFWETDALKECTKQIKLAKRLAYVLSLILLLLSAFLLGLGW